MCVRAPGWLSAAVNRVKSREDARRRAHARVLGSDCGLRGVCTHSSPTAVHAAVREPQSAAHVPPVPRALRSWGLERESTFPPKW